MDKRFQPFRSFDELMTLDNRSVLRLLREISSVKLLSQALMDAPSKLKQKVLICMSKNAQVMVREEMDSIW